MARHDAACDRWWPDKDAPEYRRELTAVAEELEAVFQASVAAGWTPLERSRVARWLADTYSDLARDQRVAHGEDLALLARASVAYQLAERLLPAGAPRDRAVLDFNCANTLRRFDVEDEELLQSAKSHYEAALGYFAEHDSGALAQVRQALESVVVLLKIAPAAKRAASLRKDLDGLGRLFETGAAASEIQAQLQRVLSDGGPEKLVRRVADLVRDLPESIRTLDRDGKLRSTVASMLLLSGKAAAAGSIGADAAVLGAIEARLERELAEGKVPPERETALRRAVGVIARAVGTPSDDVAALRAAMNDLRGGAEGLLPVIRDASYGLQLPPETSRAHVARGLFWDARRALLAELLAGGGGAREREQNRRLAVRLCEVDRELVAAGADDALAGKVEEELVRPAVVDARRFLARRRPCLANPIWPAEPARADPAAILFSGDGAVRDLLQACCRERGLALLAEPGTGELADARWRQLSAAHAAVFDLSVPPGPRLASVMYELGIAQACGKPVVVVVRGDGRLPFDIDAPTVRLHARSDDGLLFAAIDAACYGLPAASNELSLRETAAEAARRLGGGDAAARQAAVELGRMQEGADPLEVVDALQALLALAPRPRPVLLWPPWAPAYPSASGRRLFHVMPFGPAWADAVALAAERACVRASVTYVRGDRVPDPRIVPSIWREIGRATQVLVDLTGLNPNVALELGWAHLLGRPTCLVGLEPAEQLVFPAIAKLRVSPLRPASQVEELEQVVTRWLAEPA